MNRSKNKKNSNFWFFAAIAVIVFSFFQLINPIEANAPVEISSEDIKPKEETSANKSQETFQDLTDNIAEVDILMYHHIGPLPENSDKIRYGLTVSQEDFESHLKYLEENQFDVLTLGQVETAISNNKLPMRVAVLTFDDGYDDNYIYAKPLLEKYGFKATFFVISNKIGQTEYMDREQIVDLAKNHEIGSHSYSHSSMARLSDYYLEREMKKSKDDIQELIGREVKSFCYPAGKYDDRAVEKLKEYGYKIAVTTEASTGSVDIRNLFLAPRYRIAPAMSLEVLLR